MVSNKFLAALSAKLGFHRHLRFSGQIIEWQNREYVQEIEEAERESGGAADYWTTTKAPPKVGDFRLQISFSIPRTLRNRKHDVATSSNHQLQSIAYYYTNLFPVPLRHPRILPRRPLR